ncbi:MAG: hydrogenase maturation protein [Pseudomonadota bacterium]
MRILLLCRAFNGLTQRVMVELEERGHEVSVELDVNDGVTTEAVMLFAPDLVIATYLTRRLPEAVWQTVPTLIVHPGPPGDRGPAALDRAILDGASDWGVTLLQATADLDAGPVWAFRRFPMRDTTKSSLYRSEVTDAAVACITEALAKFDAGEAAPAGAPPGAFRPAVTQVERAIDWQRDATGLVLAKLRAADGQPGVRSDVLGEAAFLFDAQAEPALRGQPGTLLAKRHGAVCLATIDGAVWIGHVRPVPVTAEAPTFKLPAVVFLGERGRSLPEQGGAADIRYRESGDVGFLAFDFYNGAMSTVDCRRLLWAYQQARRRPTTVLVLEGGREFWSNGMNLMTIEAATSPAEESWANINAIDDLVEAIVGTTDKLIVAALRGNAGAGGAFLAIAADQVLARDGVVLNPHYKNMGNLFGSELWTYLLPRRMAPEVGEAMMGTRRPLGVDAALRIGLVDERLPADRDAADRAVEERALSLAGDTALPRLLAAKAKARADDESKKPLAAYRRDELERMGLNFFGFDSSYHVARYHFVHKLRPARTPFHLARHRR